MSRCISRSSNFCSRAAAILCGFLCVCAHGQDVIFQRNGEKRVGHVTAVSEKAFRFEIQLSQPTGNPGPATTATVSVPRDSIIQIEFAEDPEAERLLADTNPNRLRDAGTLWQPAMPWLAIPRSPAARIGRIYAEELLRTGKSSDAREALKVFQEIESKAWDEEERMTAKQGRLRAMVATGNAKEAIQEALELAQTTENPTVLIEANFLLAEADTEALRQLVKENPRWQEDSLVVPEHAKLYNKALDQYLFCPVFYGSNAAASARGLWGASRVYDFAGERDKALECARDILSMYPATDVASLASKYVESLPKKVTASDPDKESLTPEPTPTPEEPTQPEKPKKKSQSSKKSHAKKSTKK